MDDFSDISRGAFLLAACANDRSGGAPAGRREPEGERKWTFGFAGFPSGQDDFSYAVDMGTVMRALAGSAEASGAGQDGVGGTSAVAGFFDTATFLAPSGPEPAKAPPGPEPAKSRGRRRGPDDGSGQRATADRERQDGQEGQEVPDRVKVAGSVMDISDARLFGGYPAVAGKGYLMARTALELAPGFSAHPTFASAEAAARAAFGMGESCMEMGDPWDAEAYFREALETRRAILGSSHALTLRARCALASALAELGDLTAARAGFSETLSACEAAGDPGRGETRDALTGLMTSLVALGRRREAVAVMKARLPDRVGRLGGSHLSSIACKRDLGVALKSVGDVAGAVALLGETLREAEEGLGESDPMTLSVAGELGQAHVDAGDPVEGVRHLARAAVVISTLRPGSREAVLSRARLERVAKLLGNGPAWRLGDSGVLDAPPEGWAGRALKPLELPSSPEGTLERFAEDYWRHEAAYRVRMRLLGESHADTLMAREAFGLSCLTCGNPVAAMAHLSAVLDAAVAVSGPESGDSLRRLFNLGQATASAGDLAKAEELLALALMRHARSLGPQHELTGTVAEELSILRDSVSGGGHA